MQNVRIPLPRALRNAVRDALTAHPGWPQWRALHLRAQDGSLRDSASLRHPETFAACDALDIDVSQIAAAHGFSTPTLSDLTPEERKTMNAEIDANIETALAAQTVTPPANAFEGRDAQTIVAEVLAPADGMVGIKLYDMLAANVSALALVASQPPRVETVTVTRDRIVNVAAGGAVDAQGAPLLVPCNVAREESARTIFGLRRNECGHFKRALEAPISIWDGVASQGVPQIDPHHIWNVEALAYLCISARHADAQHPHRNASRLFMVGPPGAGKTSTPQQFAAHTNRPFVRIACDRNVESQDMTGQYAPQSGGGFAFRDGALVSAMQIPGCVILIDEPGFLRPGVAAVLQTALDTGAIFLKDDGNRRVELAQGVIIVAADNSNLTGDTGRFPDLLAHSAAFQDRFAFWVRVGYLSETDETKMLAGRTGVPAAAAQAMVRFAKLTRDAHANAQLTIGVSPRRLIAWCLGVNEGVKSSSVFAATVLALADPSDVETLRGLERNCAPHAEIDAAINGTPVDANVNANATIDAESESEGETQTPQGANAASVFTSVTPSP